MQHLSPTQLPDVDAASAEHSEKVARHIADKIAANGGAISFAAFMHEALYAQGLGYYSAGATKFGAAGDFTTAPELSSLFGFVIARQCAETLQNLDVARSDASILEFGAGSGKLAADVLTRLDALDALPIQYQILEVSPDLQERQATYLREVVPKLVDRVRWLDKLPAEHRGVVIANEVLDAMPVERFVRRNDHVAQICVTSDNGQFAFIEQEAPLQLQSAVLAVEESLGERLPDGFTSELNLAAPAWTAEVAASLQAGIAFLFDYGVSRREFYAPDRSDGWLRCHFRQHAHSEPLILPGIQDITAWIDFSAIAAAAAAEGLDIAGYVSQAHFLMNGGLTEELAGFSELATDAQMQLSAQVKLLTLPGEMGENFKCLGVSRGLDSPPASLATMDRTFTL
ncbi:MAG: class I SAM-dependent methyltransferase [Woeseiaceae bacterium]